MSRSLKKGPYVDAKILKKVARMEESNKKQPIKTWARASMISPQMVGYTLMIHDGRRFKELYITEVMVGHRLGEFAPTRTFSAHSKKGVKKPIGGEAT
jgi:small subunit ribosomal protein S19